MSHPIIYVSPELEQLRQLVTSARAQLANLETDYTKEKSRVDAVQAVLFRHLREHYQKRDRLRLTVNYRQKFLDSLIRGDEKEAKQAEENFEQAKTQADRDYEELSAAADKKQQLTAKQEAELTRLWKKLVKLYHPDRFANESDKLETYHKLTAAINRAKDSGDIETLREICDTTGQLPPCSAALPVQADSSRPERIALRRDSARRLVVKIFVKKFRNDV